MEPLFLKPFFQPKIWGGRRLESEFDYSIPDGNIGECWAISAHPHGMTYIKNGPLAGVSLADAYKKNPEYFGNPKTDKFPLLTKIIDANKDLSIQVHPDNELAEKYEGEPGKTECWYVLKANQNASLIYGHSAKNHDDLVNMISDKKWDRLLKKIPIKMGDFFYVPSGTVHAINAGTMVLETQQSSDTTYRLYDYDRIDPNTGNTRPLDLKKAIASISVPFVAPQINKKISNSDRSRTTEFLSGISPAYFDIWKWEIGSLADFHHEKGSYTLVSIVDGEGTFLSDNFKKIIKKGEHFIIPAQIKKWQLDGKLTAIASEPLDQN